MTTDEIMALVINYCCKKEEYGAALDANRVCNYHYAYVSEAYTELNQAIESLVADARRYQFMKNLSRAFSLHIDGKHAWHCQITRKDIQGPTLDAAIDKAMEAK